MAVVVVIIPIAIGVPAVAIFIPPTVPPAPAVFPCFMQVVARMICLPAVPAVVLDGFVQFVVGLSDAPLAIAIFVCGGPWRSGESHHAEKCRSSENSPSEKLLLSQMKRHVSSILQSIPDWDGVCCSIEHT